MGSRARVANRGMSRRRALGAAGLVLAATWLGAGAARALEVVVFERAGWPWGVRFETEIGRIYAATDEGRMAPLRRVDVDRPLPADLAGVDPGRFTPTFVLVEDGRELGRIRGYPGQDFFFGMLDAVLTAAGRPPPR